MARRVTIVFILSSSLFLPLFQFPLPFLRVLELVVLLINGFHRFFCFPKISQPCSGLFGTCSRSTGAGTSRPLVYFYTFTHLLVCFYTHTFSWYLMCCCAVAVVAAASLCLLTQDIMNYCTAGLCTILLYTMCPSFESKNMCSSVLHRTHVRAEVIVTLLK
jgi:hypothetical protein